MPADAALHGGAGWFVSGDAGALGVPRRGVGLPLPTVHFLKAQL